MPAMLGTDLSIQSLWALLSVTVDNGEHMDDYFEGECELNALEYEEVILKRSSSCHRLGLTLCYGATDDNDTDIFISEIESGSIADRDGRLRAGDQILQHPFTALISHFAQHSYIVHLIIHPVTVLPLLLLIVEYPVVDTCPTVANM
uniref:PDZ domain-containing protein n=1 Tax=Ascaris lumbricoides TaxID=6252 RepID=A0A0M3HX54_ASCLU